MERVWKEKKDCCGCTACQHTCPTHAIKMERDGEGFLYPKIQRDLCVDCGACRKVCPILHSEEQKSDGMPGVYGAKHRREEVLMQSTSGGAFTALSDLVLNRSGVVYGASFGRDWKEEMDQENRMSLVGRIGQPNRTDQESQTDQADRTAPADRMDQKVRTNFPLYVSHFRAQTGEERNRFRFSKYVQSDLKSVFGQVEKDIQDGRTVLFTGTPCQNAGLKSFCTRKGKPVPENLILCDVVCHSVPSPLIWQEYVDTLEREDLRETAVPRKENGDQKRAPLEEKAGRGQTVPLELAQFRTKAVPWSRQSKSFLYRRQDQSHLHTDDRYHRLLFEFQTVARPSCYSCPFCVLRRVSDLTIADYWGIEDYLPSFADSRGVSLILTNTGKGRELFEQMKEVMDWVERPPEECLAQQPRLRGPLAEPPGREEFWRAWKTGEISFDTL